MALWKLVVGLVFVGLGIFIFVQYGALQNGAGLLDENNPMRNIFRLYNP
jgi:hypothetical protein